MVLSGALLALAAAPALADTEALDPLLALAGQAAEQSQDEVAVVFMKDRLFLPPVVSVRSGGTVLFVWADSERREHHSPRSSGSTGDPARDLSGAYAPDLDVWGKCFNAEAELGQEVSGEGATYPLTLAFDPAAQRIRAAMGVFAGSAVGNLTGADPLRTCPVGTHALQGGAAVVPYACKLHGFALAGENGQMKGAVIVLP